jgi:curved DNA-binding protein CbpA
MDDGQMPTWGDFYARIGVGRSAQLDQVKIAWKKSLRKVHPDVVGPSGEAEAKKLNHAMDWLKDEQRRQRYDIWLAEAYPLRSQGQGRTEPQRRAPARPAASGNPRNSTLWRGVRQSYSPGDRVWHEAFGYGTVMKVKRGLAFDELTIRFARGEKKVTSDSSRLRHT